MKEKFNWGHGIFLFYVLFVGTMVFVVYSSTQVDRSLVLDNYYDLDIKYQERYNAIQNTLKDDQFSMVYAKNDEMIVVQINHEDPSGIIELYRPSNKSQDFIKPMTANTTSISTKELEKGFWKLKIKYSAMGKSYYKETEVYI